MSTLYLHQVNRVSGILFPGMLFSGICIILPNIENVHIEAGVLWECVFYPLVCRKRWVVCNADRSQLSSVLFSLLLQA